MSAVAYIHSSLFLTYRNFLIFVSVHPLCWPFLLSSTGTQLIDAVDLVKRKGSLVSVLFSVHSLFFFVVVVVATYASPPSTFPFQLCGLWWEPCHLYHNWNEEKLYAGTMNELLWDTCVHEALRHVAFWNTVAGLRCSCSKAKKNMSRGLKQHWFLIPILRGWRWFCIDVKWSGKL